MTFEKFHFSLAEWSETERKKREACFSQPKLLANMFHYNFAPPEVWS